MMGGSYREVVYDNMRNVVKKFIGKKENIILIGKPGAGKTHYAIALGISACLQGKSVLFASVPNLVVELKEAMSNLQISSYRRKFEKYNLVILDELGYVSFEWTNFGLTKTFMKMNPVLLCSNTNFQ